MQLQGGREESALSAVLHGTAKRRQLVNETQEL